MSGHGYVIYLDWLFLELVANFFFDYILLWATAEVARVQTTERRLAAAAALGTAYYLLFVLARTGVIPYYATLRFVPTVLLVSALMLIVTFRPRSLRQLATIAGYFYVIMFAAAGLGMAAGYLLPAGPKFNRLAGMLAATAGILVTAELGWGILQRRISHHLYQVPLEIGFGANRLRVTALVDTGNRLRDPLSGAPVIILEGSVLHEILPERLRPLLAQMEGGDLAAVSQLLTSETWSSRFRVIPFASIGRDKGLLVGFRPDEVAVDLEGRRIPVRDVVVGLYHRPLDPDGSYQALVHPEVVQAALGSEGNWLDQAVRRGGPSADASSHS